MYRFRQFCLVATLVGVPFTVQAQGAEIGMFEFMNSCAQCHGVAGQGDGVIAGFLNTRVPDLTTLQKDNGGVFPFAQVFGLVQGSDAAGAHGTSEMPAWGLRYSAQAPQMLGWDFSRADQAVFVQARILALVEYISTLQAN